MADSHGPMRYVQRLFASILSLGSGLRAYLVRLLASFTTTRPPISVPLAVTGEAPKCRFRLDIDSSDTITLPDGRKLGYAQYGSLTGRPILYMHGLPGSRIEGATYHDLGLELGARIIATDRPGIGWSSPCPGRTLLDFPKDIEHLIKHLELDDCSVMGVSGGGPYALACAASLPREKLKCVSVVCGIGPPDIGMKGARLINWIGFTFGWKYSPLVFMRWFLRSDAVGRVDLPDDQRLQLFKSSLESLTHEKDIEVLKDEDILRLILRTSRESFAQGYEGVWRDGRAMCVDWGFRIEDIRPDLPIQLWYGKHDFHVPLNHGHQIAARLGGRAQLRVEDDTHASISMNWKKEQLEGLLRMM